MRAALRAAGLVACLALQASAAKIPLFKVASVEGGTLLVDGKAAEVGAVLREGAKARLDAGEAVLELGDEGRVRLNGPAEFSVSTRAVSLTRGSLLSVLQKLKGGFSVRTPVAVAAVRGTEFFVEARADGRTYLCLCDGTLEITGMPGTGYRKTIRSNHHGSYIFSQHGKTLDRGPWKMEHHSDGDIGELKTMGAAAPPKR
ncbi:MAG: hypothetical protein FD126_3215 [Elusimicrobia bacterium]|nr:MAG: hypothetical protein FD126_3215 [Elusimicrobiota bacterium]